LLGAAREARLRTSRAAKRDCDDAARVATNVLKCEERDEAVGGATSPGCVVPPPLAMAAAEAETARADTARAAFIAIYCESVVRDAVLDAPARPPPSRATPTSSGAAALLGAVLPACCEPHEHQLRALRALLAPDAAKITWYHARMGAGKTKPTLALARRGVPTAYVVPYQALDDQVQRRAGLGGGLVPASHERSSEGGAGRRRTPNPATQTKS